MVNTTGARASGLDQPALNPELERELESKIDPWLAHMRWRADFAQWRYRRIWQENFQHGALADLEHYANGVLLNARVLDLGAGMGGFSVAASRNTPARAIIALDYNLAYCEITRARARRYSLNLPALVAAGEHLPFADTSFQILTCWDVVEHVQDPARLFSEIARVLAPDGLAFVTMINRFAFVDPHYHLRFINWLPRPLAEKYIAWRRRTKDSPLRDRQKFSDMHYFTFRGAEYIAARYGFSMFDLNQARSRFNRLPRPLNHALYSLWRLFGMGTFRLVLMKNSPLSHQDGRGAGRMTSRERSAPLAPTLSEHELVRGGEGE